MVRQVHSRGTSDESEGEVVRTWRRAHLVFVPCKLMLCWSVSQAYTPVQCKSFAASSLKGIPHCMTDLLTQKRNIWRVFARRKRKSSWGKEANVALRHLCSHIVSEVLLCAAELEGRCWSALVGTAVGLNFSRSQVHGLIRGISWRPLN